MSGVLLDTNAVLWLLTDAADLGQEARSLVRATPAWVSAVSVWEIEIKRAIGGLHVGLDLRIGLEQSGLRELPLTWAQASEYARPTLDHRDPFDRMLVAQALSSDLKLLTADRRLLDAALPFVVDARK